MFKPYDELRKRKDNVVLDVDVMEARITVNEADIATNLADIATGDAELAADKTVALGLTADVGSIQGGQVLAAAFNEVTISGTAGDAVTLPAVFAVGEAIVVKNNAAANAIDIFPASGDDLGQGAETAIALAADAGAKFVGAVADTTWLQVY